MLTAAEKNFEEQLVTSRENRKRTIAASNALFVLWSRSDDPARRYLLDESQDELRHVIAEKEHLLVVCRELWRPKWETEIQS